MGGGVAITQREICAQTFHERRTMIARSYIVNFLKILAIVIIHTMIEFDIIVTVKLI